MWLSSCLTRTSKQRIATFPCSLALCFLTLGSVIWPAAPWPPPLVQFGSGFLSKFECAQCDNRLLEEVTLVDTPGALLCLSWDSMGMRTPGDAVACW